MALVFQEAKREKIWVKALLGAPSGGGKTYTALRLATGIANKCGGKIAAIDTENGRIKYYANEFKFSMLQLDEPYTPEKYIEAIDAAVDAGFSVLIIDSTSHEWAYCKDTHNKMPGNSWTNWGKITPRHDAFCEKILQSPIHVIATVRGKDEYIAEDKDGKTVPKKVGIGFEQRGNVEYDYTITFNLDQSTHVAEVMKDNTHLFEGRYDVLTEKDGALLYDWANSGEGVMPVAPKAEFKEAEKKLEDYIGEIKEFFEIAISEGKDKEALYNIVTKCGAPKNFLKITDADIAKKVLNGLKGVNK